MTIPMMNRTSSVRADSLVKSNDVRDNDPDEDADDVDVEFDDI